MHHTVNFPEFHVDWMSPEEVYLHRENAPSQIYRGISASLGFKKPSGNRLFRGYKELCQHNGKPTHVAATITTRRARALRKLHTVCIREGFWLEVEDTG